MHVGVHPYAVVAEAYRNYKIGRFPTDARKLQQLVHEMRYAAAIFLEQNPAHLNQVLCLRMIEPDRKDQALNFGDG